MASKQGKKPLSATVDEFGEITKLSVILLYSDMPGYRIAALAGFPHSRLSEYARGRVPIPIHHLVALSEVFGMEPEDIVGTIKYEIYLEAFSDEEELEDTV